MKLLVKFIIVVFNVIIQLCSSCIYYAVEYLTDIYFSYVYAFSVTFYMPDYAIYVIASCRFMLSPKNEAVKYW
jgi:hypothetical protein